MNCKFLPLLMLALGMTAMLFSVDARSLQQFAVAETDDMFFLENKGQIVDQYGNSRSDVDLTINSSKLNVFIGPGQIQYQWVKAKTAVSGNESVINRLKDADMDLTTFRMDVILLDANNQAQIIKEHKKNYYETHYLPQTGSTEVISSSYQKITYKDIYPGIDWVLYIRDNKLAYDFVIHAEGKVSDIKLQYAGASSLRINEDGSFKAITPFGSIVESAPYSFQDDGQFVASSFVLKENILAFSTEEYEGTLTIDPSVLWGTYYGGSGFFDYLVGSASDNNGNVYMCGMTTNVNNIATVGSHQVNLSGASDAFLVKFDESGIRLWSTYYGGANGEWGYSVVCDTSNNVYMSGVTGSTAGVATTGSHQSDFAGGGELGDAFLVKFDSSGTRQWATYYGGSELEYYPFVTFAGGYLYMSGGTNSANSIATAGSFQQVYAGSGDAFLVKFSLDGIRQWATYYGGEGYDGLCTSLSSDQNGHIYIAGSTSSNSGIATAGSFQASRAGKDDAFLVKFDEDGLRHWGTYYGGEENESLLSRHVGCDALGNIYISGYTESNAGIATPGSHQSTYQGSGDAFLVKFNDVGDRVWGTYFGGSGQEQGGTLYCTDSNAIFLTGGTASTTGIATADAIQGAYAGSGVLGDAFLASFNDSGQQKWGTYYGGAGSDAGVAVTSDAKGNVYLAGITTSLTDIATPGSHQDVYPGGLIANSFLAKFCFTIPASMLQIRGADSICRNTEATFSVAEIDEASDYLWTAPSGWAGASHTNSITLRNDGQSGEITLRVVRCGDTSEVSSVSVFIFPPEQPEITVSGFQLGTVGTYSSYQWLLNGQILPGASGESHTAVENGDYSVVVVNEKGCVDTSGIYTVENVGVDGRIHLGDKIRIYPNPIEDLVFIHAPFDVILIVSTIEGKEVVRQRDTVLDVKSYLPGVYLIQLYTADGQLIRTEKMIKIK